MHTATVHAIRFHLDYIDVLVNHNSVV